MSQAALLRATYEILRMDIPGMVPSRIGIHYDGQPPAHNAQPLYLSIHPAGWQPGPSEDIHEATEEQFGVALTITMRTSVVPRDQWGKQAYLRQVNSIEAAARDVFNSMHRRRYDLMQRANEYAGVVNQSVEPLLFEGAPLIPQPVGADWFHAQPEGDVPNIPDGRRKDYSGIRQAIRGQQGAAEPLEYQGLVLELKYFGARRICPLDIVDQWVRVDFKVTRDVTPPVTGTYGGNPDSIVIRYAGTDYDPVLSAGVWSIPEGLITFPIGSHDIEATATYEKGAVVVTDNTVDEITIIDASQDWLWTDNQYHVWSDDKRALWN